MGSEEHISALEALSERTDLTDEQREALEESKESIAFSQALWDLFRDQALHTDDGSPDYNKMENLVDAINGELAAAVLFLCRSDVDTARALVLTADNLEKMRMETVNEADNVPQVIIEGNRRLAQRIQNTKVILNAQRITRILPEKKTR